MKLKPIGEQVVVVMGASTGIGRLTALELARRGAKVVASARDEESLQSLVQEIRDAGGTAAAVRAEIADPVQVQAVADFAESKFGRIDTWVNMAATSVYATFENTTAAEFQRVVTVNLLGYANGARAALPVLKRGGGGAIINVSSVEARVALPFHSAYAASKHGVAALNDALRIELKHDRVPISVTNVMPASIDTPFFDHARTKLGVKPRPMPPVYRPEKVVGAVLYAATHPTREMVVGAAGRVLIGARVLVPALCEMFLATFAFRSQKTALPRSAGGPNALMVPLGGDRRIKGEAGAALSRVRAPLFLSRHPGATLLGLAVALFAVPKLHARFGR